MSIAVNPPPQLRIPEQFLADPETRPYFEGLQIILFQLYNRTGAARDDVSGRQVVITTSTDIVLDVYSQLIVVDASDNPVSVSLPLINEDNVGEAVDIAVIDATNDVTVIPRIATVFGDVSAVMTQQFQSIQYTAVSTSVWIGT